MTVLLIAGIGVILAGLAAIGFGIPVKEFGFGNTLILTGAIGVCTGLILIGMAVILRELRKLPQQFAAAGQDALLGATGRELPMPLEDADDEQADAEYAAASAPLFSRDQPPPRPSTPEPGVPPWQDEVLRDRERMVAAAAAESANAEPKRRNLLFQSSRRERSDAVRPDREAAAPQGNEAAAPEEPALPPRARVAPRQPAEHPRSDALRRAARPSGFSDRVPDPSMIPDRDEPEPEPAPEVTVLKSGVVDGMAYSLYSDGSIEAQLPEGTMRFASIDELRDHLDSRG
jgi:hypothetical protein